jgi:hypothetical protein
MELGAGRLERVRGVRKIGAREYTFTLNFRVGWWVWRLGC